MKGKNHASKVYMSIRQISAHSYSMCSCMRGRERGIKNCVTRRELAIARIRGDKGHERREGVERKEEE